MILKFSNKVDSYKSVILYSQEIKRTSDELLECLSKIYELCKVCRIFTTCSDLEINNSDYLVHSKLNLQVHSGSMIDEETLEREIRNMICFPPFNKKSMTWSLE